jgi:RHS repeat-associated protein
MSGTEFQTGEWGLEGLDLNYFAARYYDPILGRWHAPDPLEQCHSPYLAMLGDPANFIDPDGRAGIPFLQDFNDSFVGDFLECAAGASPGLGFVVLELLGPIGGTIANIVSIGASIYASSSSVQTIADFSGKGGFSAGAYSEFNFCLDFEMPGYGKSCKVSNGGSFSPPADPLPQPGYIWAVDVINGTLTFLGTASSYTHTFIYTMGSALDENGTYHPSTSFASTVTDENGNVVSSDVFQRAFELGYYTSSNFSTVDYSEWLNSWAEQSAAFEELYEMSKTTIETAAIVMDVGLTLGAGSFAKWSIKKFFKKKLLKEGGEESIKRFKNFRYPGKNPSKAPKGFEWRGKPGSKPGSKDGNWYNPKTGETLRPDLDHPFPIGPHWDYKDPSGNWWRIFEDGRMLPK